MRLRTTSHIPVLIAVTAFLAAACTDGPPTSVTDASAPNFSHKPGHNPGGGGGGKPGSGDPPITVTFSDNETDNISSDGRGTYADGCNVSAKFNLEDAILNLKGRIKKQDQASCGDPRRILVDFTDRVSGSPPSPQDGTDGMEGTFMNVDHVEMVTGTESSTATFHVPGCGMGLRFNSTEQVSEEFPVNDVEVTQNSDGTWTVKTLPGEDVAVCVPSVQGEERRYYHMPFSLTVALEQ